MPEKWAGFALQASRRTSRLTWLPRFYVAAFILIGRRLALWTGLAAVQRLARYMLSQAWPDVAGYTYAETSQGLGVQNPDFKASVFRIKQINSREAQ
jgi:hypothetical protein